jgi:bidirectional [NiFe] hydrogenase diaphorase subunit
MTKKKEPSEKKATVVLEINGTKVRVPEDTTILEACRQQGIRIPTLCHHEKLKPYGACRLCLVEVVKDRKSSLVASCGYYAHDGLTVLTDSPKVERVRKLLVEMLMALVPESIVVRELAEKYGIEKTRYHKEKIFCINCGLCVRYCAEVKGKNVVGHSGRGQKRLVAWMPLSGYKDHCENCMECMKICPTGVFPSNWGIGDAV